MAIVEIRIPQLGEGLQEARLIRFLKQPGDSVARDEPIYEMETDKAVMEIESPAAGVLQQWSANEDDVLPIGAVIGRIDADGAAAAAQPSAASVPEAAAPSVPGTPAQVSAPSAPAGELRAGAVPPRTRAYAREKGLTEAQLAEIAAGVAKVMPEDVDRYLGRAGMAPTEPTEGEAPTHSALLRAGSRTPSNLKVTAGAPTERTPSNPPQKDHSHLEGARSVGAPSSTGYRDVPMGQRHRTLVYRLQQATRDVVPATMEIRLDWGPIERARARLKENPSGPQPSQFLLFAYCVAQAAKNHPRFRSALQGEGTLREYDHLHLGIAVARPDDELLLARVPDADARGFPEFVAAAQSAIQKARDGEDQAADVMQLSLTNMAGQGVRMGIPVIAAPAAGTLFIGEPFDEAHPLPGGGIGFRRTAAMVLSFDHRIANGVGAANFLAEIRERVAGLMNEIG